MQSIHDIKVKTIDGREIGLRQYRGKVALVVNVASRCGFTPQYGQLQELYEKYKDRGFTILGFPCDDFLGQEPAGNMEILDFCKTRYNVRFDLFAKIKILGENPHPLYKLLLDAQLPLDIPTPRIVHWMRSAVFFLKGAKPPPKNGIQWNFQKFLVDKEGMPVAAFSPWTKPLSSRIVSRIEEALKR